MGFHADKTKPPVGKTHVKYFLDTGKVAPYCRMFAICFLLSIRQCCDANKILVI
jgi:hypothetical protein